MTEKVLMLFYAEPKDGSRRRAPGLLVQERPDFEELQPKGMMCHQFKTKDFIKGRIRMFYGEEWREPNIKVNGVTYCGPVLFIARDENGKAADMTAREVQAIKLVVSY